MVNHTVDIKLSFRIKQIEFKYFIKNFRINFEFFFALQILLKITIWFLFILLLQRYKSKNDTYYKYSQIEKLINLTCFINFFFAALYFVLDDSR